MQLKHNIETLWNERLDRKFSKEDKDYISQALELLDKGAIRVAQNIDGKWVVNDWLKKAILLSFKAFSNEVIKSQSYNWFDKVRAKTANWTQADFEHAGFRSVPASFARYSAFVAKNVILMPSFINVGAYVDEGTMIDTWATVGSCAQIGKNCHISGGVGIGGVLEPLQASPVIIEDNCFIGARSEVAEGVIVGKGSVLSMGVYVGSSTKILDRATGEVSYGYIPPYSVVVPGSLPSKEGGVHLYCVVIVKKVDEKTRSKTSINDLLR